MIRQESVEPECCSSAWLPAAGHHDALVLITAKLRVLPRSSEAHVEQLNQERREPGRDYHDHGVLFSWEDGRPPHPDTITRKFKKLAAAPGLPEIDLHDLRHAALSLWLNASGTPAEVAARAGNSPRVLHEIYLHCTDGQDDTRQPADRRRP